MQEFEPTFQKMMQLYTSSKEEAEYWNDSNSKLVYRFCETWWSKGLEQLEQWSSAVVKNEIAPPTEPEKTNVPDSSSTPKDEAIPKMGEYVPSFGQDQKRASLPALKNNSSVPSLSGDGHKSNPRLAGDIKRSTNLLSPPQVKHSIPALSHDIKGSIPILGAQARGSILKPALESSGIEEKRDSLLRKPGVDLTPTTANPSP
jgi:hypothetical protein